MLLKKEEEDLQIEIKELKEKDEELNQQIFLVDNRAYQING